ncbi:MAG: GAF domain-containing SpoIIE family protein phosphatase [Bacteroidota bacterium]
MARKSIIRISLFLAIVSWMAMSFTDLTVLFGQVNDLDVGIADNVPDVFFIIFALSLFSFFRFRIEAVQRRNFIDLLWKIFVTGLLTTVVSLLLKSLDYLMGNTNLISNPLLIDFLFHIHLGLLVAFLISTYVVWIRLILYQKSKLLLSTWTIFEYLLFTSLLTLFLPGEYAEYFVYPLVIIAIVLSANMKWVAYLNFKQKWKSILLLVLTLLYLIYFYINIAELRSTNEFLSVAQESVFISALFIFTAIYSSFSLLVILFNLPTSSVLEQKLEEVVNFQRLSQSIQTEQSENQVYEILLESSARTAKADAAWIEARIEDKEIVFRHNIEKDTIFNIKHYMSSLKGNNLFDFDNVDKVIKPGKHLRKLKGVDYNSIIAFPIEISGERIGMLVMMKELKEGFTRELVEITQTFVNQAGISIDGFRMVAEALENERYKEELNIAKEVQSKLLPTVLDTNPDFDIAAYSKSADEVGGDYYDSFKINDNKIALIIGDVSGKGTSAAFHMSQVKGVFHALAQLDLPPEEFLIRANKAIITSLDKTSFVTISYFVIDRTEKKVEFARAGHCPSLYFTKQDSNASYFKNKGLGLGIVRNESYAQYVQPRQFRYKSGDILVLYTDGITEAMNFKGEEYGYDRLAQIVSNNGKADAGDLQKKIIDDLYKFCGQTGLNDDYTTVIIKFK